MKFKKGDKVLFNTLDGKIPNFRTESDGIPDDLIIHGNSVWDGKPGKVVAILNDYVIVNYTNEEGREMQLGFEESDIKLANQKLLNPTHAVIWEEDTDPVRLFTSDKDAKEFIKDLIDKPGVKKDSILLIEIKSCKEIRINKVLRYNQHKI